MAAAQQVSASEPHARAFQAWGAKVARAAMVTGNGSYGLISDFIEVRGVLTAR